MGGNSCEVDLARIKILVWCDGDLRPQQAMSGELQLRAGFLLSLANADGVVFLWTLSLKSFMWAAMGAVASRFADNGQEHCCLILWAQQRRKK